jgi:hypothetical protein
VIAEIRKSGALPILIWLFLFPTLMVVMAFWERTGQRRVVVEAVEAALGPDAVGTVQVTSNMRWGNKRTRLACGVAGANGERAFAAVTYRSPRAFRREVRQLAMTLPEEHVLMPDEAELLQACA